MAIDERIVATDVTPYAASSLSVSVLAFSHGGYFPEAWGWAAIVLAWCAAVAIMLRHDLEWSLPIAGLAIGFTAISAWAAFSLIWTDNVAVGMESVERDILYVSLMLLALATASSRSRVPILAGVTTAIVATSSYSLATRLFPDRAQVFSDVQGPGRLYNPLGYWNAEAEFTAIGLVLCVCWCMYSRNRSLLQAAAAGAIPTLCLAIFFTYSRGPIVAVCGGVAILLLLEPRRLRVAAWLLILAPCSLLIVLEASSDRRLSSAKYGAAAAPDGHRLFLLLLVASGFSAATPWFFATCERKVAQNARMRKMAVVLVLAGAVIAGLWLAVEAGSPRQTLDRVEASIKTSGPTSQSSARIQSLSPDSRVALWTVAWDTLNAHPFGGAGAGSFETEWRMRRHLATDTRFAHSIVLEAAAEGGYPGAALMMVVLLAPLAGAVKWRRSVGTCAAAAAYATFLIHASFDWDWEVPALGASGLWCAVALVAEPTWLKRSSTRVVRTMVVVGSAAIILLAAGGLAGNRDIARSQQAGQDGHYTVGVAAALAAARWQPWSYVPYLLEGQWREASGDLEGARAAYRRATKADPEAWDAWFALAQVAVGNEQAAALRHAVHLNPYSRQIADFCVDSPTLGCPGISHRFG